MKFLIHLCLFASLYFDYCLTQVLTNSYHIEFHDDVDRALADDIANRHGFINFGPVSFLLILWRNLF